MLRVGLGQQRPDRLELAAAAASPAAAAAVASPPATRKTGFSSFVGRTSLPARMPGTIATIIAVSTEAMILFHSKDDIGDPSGPGGRQKIGFPPTTQLNYHAFGDATNRACCRCPPKPQQNPRRSCPVTRTAPLNPIIMIPARLAATRLPGKPLAEIAGVPMIVHVWRRAVAAGVGPVVVACGDRAIADAVEAAGGRAVLTDPHLPTGSDRIRAAIARLDPGRAHDAVINVQGDLPMLDPAAIRVAARRPRRPRHRHRHLGRGDRGPGGAR